MAAERKSEKRDAILALLRRVRCHPSAEWVYNELRRTYPGLSLGTVYRNLRRLTESGLIRSVGVVDGQERFDGNLSAHGHFVCQGCGAVLDVELSEDGLDALAGGGSHGRVTGVEVRLTGLCRDCLDKDIRA